MLVLQHAGQTKALRHNRFAELKIEGAQVEGVGQTDGNSAEIIGVQGVVINKIQTVAHLEAMVIRHFRQEVLVAVLDRIVGLQYQFHPRITEGDGDIVFVHHRVK